MRILGSVVAPLTTLMSSCDSKITGSGSIRYQIVRDELVWDKAILLQKLAHEFQRRTLVPSALNQHIKHFALGIHGAPKIPCGRRFSGRLHPNARSCVAWAGVCAGPPRSSA